MAKKLSTEIVLEDIRNFIENNNTTLLKDYKKNGKHSESTIIKYFGNWSNVLKELNIDSKFAKIISKQDVIADVIRIFNDTNNTTRENYLKYGRYSRAPIERLFGGWNNLLRELDLEINMNRNVTKDDVIKDMLNLKNKYGKVTSIIQRKYGKYSQIVIDRLFGSYTNLAKELGFDIYGRYISDEEIIQNLKDIYNKYNIISADIIDNECIVTRNTLYNRFGNLKDFLESINIDTFNYRKMSKLQQYMLSICEEIFGKDYELEKTFDWLRNPKTNHKLFIDIYYKKLNLAIEVDGSQHYQKYKWHEELEIISERDFVKDKLLKEHNIKIIRLKYNDSSQVVIDKLLDFKNK